MTGVSPEETALFEAARGGDQRAFTSIYERYARMVHGILLARVPRHEVDDLLQDVFITVLKRMHTLREVAAFPAWVATIARNRATDWYRRSPDTTELDEQMAAPAHDDDVDARAALEAVRQLPEAYRETLILRLVEGMTGEEIAERTGLRPASVRVNLHRGMKMLREKLGKGSGG